jgi:hypothetical protein
VNRPRGAQPGNHNALKHGFYSRLFHRAELRDLQTADPTGLVDEINLLRLHLRRLLECQPDLVDFYQLVEYTRLVNLLAAGINRLVRTQAYLTSVAPQVADQLQQALQELEAEGLFDQPPTLQGSTPPPREELEGD